MTHATQLALMVVWLGSELSNNEHARAAWDAANGSEQLYGMEWDLNACDLTNEGPVVGRHSILTRFPSCPECCVLLDMAREVAP